MEKELLKDKELIGRINFKTLKINNLRKKLINNGWVIKEDEEDDKVKVRIYESVDDVEWSNHLYEAVGVTSDDALITCLTVIKEWQEKILHDDN